MLTDSIALAPSSTTTALPVATTRSAPCGGSGSWAVLMRMRSPGERAGHEAAVRDGQAVVGRPDHDGEGRVPGFCEQGGEMAGQVVHGAQRADGMDARDVDSDVVAVLVTANIGQVGVRGRLLVGRGPVPVLVVPLDDPPAAGVLAHAQGAVPGEQGCPYGGRFRAADHYRVARRRGGGARLDLIGGDGQRVPGEQPRDLLAGLGVLGGDEGTPAVGDPVPGGAAGAERGGASSAAMRGRRRWVPRSRWGTPTLTGPVPKNARSGAGAVARICEMRPLVMPIAAAIWVDRKSTRLNSS